MSIHTKIASLLTSLAIVGSGPLANALQPLPADAPLPSKLPGLVSRRIQIDLAQRLNVPTQNIFIKEATPQTWSDRCLGLEDPNTSCAQGETKGWRVEVESAQQRWVYRSDRTASNLRLEPLPYSSELNQTDFSAEVSQTMLETVSQQVRQPVDRLQVLQVHSALWDSCLGISTPNAECLPSKTPGFKVIVSNVSKDRAGWLQRGTWPDFREYAQDWVYHLDADAAQVVQNTAASDLQGTVASFFEEREFPLEPLRDDVVFQEIIRNHGDSIHTITLMIDGKLTIDYFSQRTGEKDNELYQISDEGVAAFEEVLQQQQFFDFNRMSYVNEDPLMAIDSFTLLRAPGIIVFPEGVGREFPENLQTVLEAWSDLISRKPPYQEDI